MSEQPARELIGGRYQILTTLGRGGMGLVYRAHDPVLERDVAIKKMATSIVDSDEHRRRFQIEARAAARLNHPNIVTIFELEEYRGDFYIVMELLEGLSLAAFMQRRPPLPLTAQLTVLAQVCDALDFAHARDIVHRDIKPANIVLLPSGIVKILDFGIAQLASSDLTRKGVLLGTPNYMSPEQINGLSVDARADLFSAGAVAYEMAAGVKAFTADSMAMLLMKISEASYPPLSDVAPDTPPALVALIGRLLAKDRDARPARGCDVREALEQIGAIDRLDLVADAVQEALAPSEGDTIVFRASGDRPTTPVASRSLMSPHRSGGSTRADTQTPGGTVAPPPPPATATPAPPPDAAAGTGDAPQTLNLGPSDPSAVPPPQAPAEVPAPAAAPVTAAPVAAPPPLPTGSEVASSATPPPLPPGLAPLADDARMAPLDATQVAPLGLMDSPAAPPAGAPSASAPAASASGAAQPAASLPGLPLPGAAAQAGPAQAGPIQPGVAPSAAAVVPGAAVPAARRAGNGTAILVVGLLAALIAIFVGASWLWWQRLRGSIKIPTYTASHQTPANTEPPPAANSTTPPAADTPPAEVKSEEVKPEEAKPAEVSPGESKPSESAPPAVEATPAPPPVDTRPTETRPAETRPADTRPVETPPAPAPRREVAPDVRPPSREPAPPVDSTPPPPPPKPTNSRPTATEPDTAPVDTPAPEPPRPGRSQRPRTAVDSETVGAFRKTGDAAAQLGGDQTMNAAAVIRIKDILERYGHAIEQHDTDTLHSLRDSLTPAEQKLLDGPAVTVRFADIDVSVESTQATARARRTVIISGRPTTTDIVDIRLTRRPSGWVITSLSR